MVMHRANAFPADPLARMMPRKEPRPGATDRLTPTVSRDMAEIAGHLTENPVFLDLFGILKKEAMDRLCNSPLGEAGTVEREAARYELAALASIENRIGAIAAEIHLFEPRENHADS